MKNKCKNTKRINKQMLIATVDIGKVNHYGYCRCPDGSDIKPFLFSNNLKGFNDFWERIDKIKQLKGLKQTVVSFESTGSYGEPLKHFLKNKGVELLQVNPMHTKKLKELQGNSPNKTDEKDPKVIADIIELGHGLTVIIPQGVVADLRQLIKGREKRLEDIGRINNRLESILAMIFPEFLQIMKGFRSKSSMYLLTGYSTPASIVQLGARRLTQKLRKISRGRLGEQRATALYGAATYTVGIEQGLLSIKGEIAMSIHQISLLEQQLKQIEAQITILLGQVSYSPILLSMKGIGEITAAGLIAEVVDFKDYSTISEITKLAGLNLYEVSSGKHKGKRSISKRGRPLLRKILFFASMNMVRRGGLFHEDYQRYLANGMKKIQALTAIAKKLLRTIFAMVRDNQVYIENYYENERAA